MNTVLVDSHCHLDFEQFDGKLDDVNKVAAEHDVRYMQTICTRMSDFDTIHGIAQKYDHIFCSVGVHPNNVAETDLVTREELYSKTHHDKVIGVGETGLDYFYETAPRQQQQDSFATHLEVSAQAQLPVIVHSRDADEDTVDILASHMKQAEFPGLIHCFSTTEHLAKGALDLGLYISIAGIVTFKKATELQDIVRWLPLDRILVETDSPYLAPTPHRGKTNQPAYTHFTAKYIAELKNISYEEVAKTTTNNFFNLFSKAQS